MTKHSLLRGLCGREIRSFKSLLRWLVGSQDLSKAESSDPSKYVVLVTFGCCDKMSYKGNKKGSIYFGFQSVVALGHSGRSVSLLSSLTCSRETGECWFLAHFSFVSNPEPLPCS